MRTRLVALTLVLSPLLAPRAAALDVEGTVFNTDDCSPIRDVKVSLRPGKGSTYPRMDGAVDANGRFRFTGAPSETVLVEVTAGTRTVFRRTVDLAQRSRLNIGLVPNERSKISLGPGSKGPDVEVLQKRLREQKYYAGPIDGSYNSNLEAAVKAFQARNGIQADGNVHARSWRAIVCPSPTIN